VLEGNVEVLADVVVLRDGFEELAGDAVGIGIEEAEPAQAVDAGELVEQRGETVLEAEIFAVAGGVWPMSVISRTPRATSCCASATTDSKRRERNLPRRFGMTQKLQGWSQPSAILM